MLVPPYSDMRSDTSEFFVRGLQRLPIPSRPQPTEGVPAPLQIARLCTGTLRMRSEATLVFTRSCSTPFSSCLLVLAAPSEGGESASADLRNTFDLDLGDATAQSVRHDSFGHI